MAQQAEVKRAKEAHKKSILSKPNVIGVGTGYKQAHGGGTQELCVVALVRRKVPRAGLTAGSLVPKQVAGVPTDVVEVGDLRALQLTPRDRWRPAPAGVSLGHYQITAGTFGAVVRDQTTGERLLLSNNHVLANSNNATLGDPILQPGAADGGRVEDDTLAELVRFCPLEFTNQPGSCEIAASFAALGNALANLAGSKHQVRVVRADPQATNLVDAAVARPIDDSQILDEIMEIGPVTGTTLPISGDVSA